MVKDMKGLFFYQDIDSLKNQLREMITRFDYDSSKSTASFKSNQCTKHLKNSGAPPRPPTSDH
jgi:hypothetical protein